MLDRLRSVSLRGFPQKEVNVVKKKEVVEEPTGYKACTDCEFVVKAKTKMCPMCGGETFKAIEE